MAGVLDHVWEIYVNDSDFAFRQPMGTETPPLQVWVYDVRNSSGVRMGGQTHPTWDRMEISSSSFREWRKILLHELFHRAQYAYSGEYPLARFLWLTVNYKPGSEMDPLRREFVKFIFSRQGQEVVVKDGYLPVSGKIAEDALKSVGIQ